MNTVKINREELLTALSIIKPASKKRTGQAISENFIFNGEYVFSSDGRLLIAFPLESTEKFAIRSSEFFQVLGRIKRKEIDCTFGKKMLSFSSGKLTAEIPIVYDEHLYSKMDSLNLPERKSKKWKPVAKDFIKALKTCLFSISKDLSERELCCAYVNGKTLVGADEFRTSMYIMEEKMDSLLLPVYGVEQLVKIKDIEKYCITEKVVFFLAKSGVVFGCAALPANAEYFDYEGAFDFEGTLIRLPDELKEIVKTAAILAEGEDEIDKKILVTIKKGKITCRGESDLGNLEEEAEIKYSKKKKVSFLINPIFFEEILNKTTSIKCGELAAMFTMQNFKHVVALFPEDDGEE